MTNTIRLSDILSKEDLRAYRQTSNIKAAAILSGNWILITLSFALFVIWPHPLTFIAGVILLGGRQLGLGVLMHDCAHHAFFTGPKANEFMGHWFCGVPINTSVTAYRDYHLKHHQFAGTDKDPDKIFVHKYPISKDSLIRKFFRDATGQTGIRDAFNKAKNFKLSRDYGWLLFHIALLTGFSLIGAPLAYLMWWAAELFIYPILARLRQIGEHGVAPDRNHRDARLNTGTTLASWWERLFIAPNSVFYHMEHHLFAAVPSYNLARLHQQLDSGGYYEGYNSIASGYAEVLRRAVKA